MKIAYCTNVRLPNERAHGYQVAKVTEAMALLGHTVEVFAPYRENFITEEFSSYHNLQKKIPVHHLGTVDGIAAWWAPGVLGLKLTTYLFSKELVPTVVSRKKDFDVLYTRTPELLPSLLKVGLPVVMELHRIPNVGVGRFLNNLKRCSLVVALTSPMRDVLVEAGVKNVPIVVEGDAVDLEAFKNVEKPEAIRYRYQIPKGVPLIAYTGQLQSMGLSKGVPELLGALDLLAQRGLEFRAVIAGGPAKVRDKFHAELPSTLTSLVRFPGHLPHQQVLSIMNAADVLVYPAPKSSNTFYMRDTSPLKILEYMGSGKPLVSADLPPLHDLLDSSMALLCPAGDPQALADSIRETLENKEAAASRAKAAYTRVQLHTWKERMQRILERISLS